MKGPSGAPDNLLRLQVAIGSLLPEGTIAMLDVEHDAGCPCLEDGQSSAGCTCELVNVTVQPVTT